MRISKSQILLGISGFIITSLAIFLITNYRTPPRNILLKQGFDFRRLKLDDKSVDKPKIGNKIDIASLIDINGVAGDKILKSGEEKLILLVIISPRCNACKISRDLFENIRDSSRQLGISYNPTSFIPIDPSVDLKVYAESFGFRNFLQWDRNIDIPEQLTRLVTPTHILINTEGIVVHVWPGTSNSPAMRKTMSEQISSDLALISETLATADLFSY